MALPSVGAAADAAQEAARRGVSEAAPWVQRLARLGYAAKGVVYVIVGGLALQAAFGSGRRPDGSSDALGVILDQPFGRLLLALVALGLVGYVVWRFVQAALDPEGKGSDAKGSVQRVGYLVSAALYAALALQAARLALGGGGSGGDGAEEGASRALDLPFGPLLLGLVALGVAGYGAYELYRAWAKDPTKRLDLGGLSPDARTWIGRFGRAGRAARGVVFLLIGWFLGRAALQGDAGEAGGMGEALGALEGRGPWILGAVALGLLAYGLFQLVEARYRRIRAA